MKSQGYCLIQTGEASRAFNLREIELPALKEHEVLVEVEAFGLNYADVMARHGLYREAPPMPSVIGYEVVGKIVEVGTSVDASRIGKRVVAFTRFGGYAKHAITPSIAAIEIGEIDANNALSIATQGVTAYYMAEYLAPIHPNDRVLIHAAAGGVGSILIQLAKQKGAIVFAKVGSDEKKEIVRSIGADYAINYKTTDYIKQANRFLEGKKMDVIFNPVGGSTFKQDRSILAHGGRLFMYGGSELAEGKLGILSKLNFLRKMGVVIPVGLMIGSRNLLGINMLRIADHRPDILEACLKGAVKLFEEGKINPLTGGQFPSSKLAEAHTLLESGKSSGKISVHWEKE